MTSDYEISRLKTPLTFKDYKAYDLNDDLANCVDLIDSVEFFLEPDDNVLSDSEVLQHAPKSKAASKIRLENGFGNIHDILNLNPSIPWILGLYYVLLIYLFMPYLYYINKPFMFIFVILLVIPLYYLAYKFNLNRYIEKYLKSSNKPKVEESKGDNNELLNQIDNKTLKEYKKQFKQLTKVYDDKEKFVKKVIEKKFASSQLTCTKFMVSVDKCHELFYKELDNAYTIIELNKSNLKVREELENEIEILNLIMKQIDDLSDELIITLGSDESNEEIEELLSDMGNLIKSIKDYD